MYIIYNINEVIKFNFFLNIFLHNFIINNWWFYNKMNYLWIFNNFILLDY